MVAAAEAATALAVATAAPVAAADTAATTAVAVLADAAGDAVAGDFSFNILFMLQKFCVVDPFSVKINKWTLKQENFIFQAITYFSILIAQPSKVFFISIADFVVACSLPRQFLLIDIIPLQYSSLILVYPTLNLRTHRFTIDFLIAFHTLHHAHSRVKFTTCNQGYYKE